MNPKCDNAKNKLQEFCQWLELRLPEYEYDFMENVQEKYSWNCCVTIQRAMNTGILKAIGLGATKKEASMHAAREMLRAISYKVQI